MGKRKYTSYTIVTDTDVWFMENWKDAFSKYMRSETATLYGTDEYGECSIVMAK